jgi:DNA-binding response OmpR family regulator
MADPTVLIVDDDDDLALGIGIRLRSSGFEVLTAPDAWVALQRALRDRPDVVILDLGLPAGGGMTFLQRARSNLDLALMPVIVLTAQDHSVEAEVLEAGATEFLQKPVDNETLIAAIMRALGRDNATV